MKDHHVSWTARALLLLATLGTASFLLPEGGPGLNNSTPKVHKPKHLWIDREDLTNSGNTLTFETVWTGVDTDAHAGIAVRDTDGVDWPFLEFTGRRFVIDYSVNPPTAKMHKINGDGSTGDLVTDKFNTQEQEGIESENSVFVVDTNDVVGALILVNHNGWLTTIPIKDVMI